LVFYDSEDFPVGSYWRVDPINNPGQLGQRYLNILFRVSIVTSYTLLLAFPLYPHLSGGIFFSNTNMKNLTIFQKPAIQTVPALIKTVAPGQEIFHHTHIDLKTVSVQFGPNSGQGARR
jgi:hypothetical protein